MVAAERSGAKEGRIDRFVTRRAASKSPPWHRFALAQTIAAVSTLTSRVPLVLVSAAPGV